jgi:hypothetical protein
MRAPLAPIGWPGAGAAVHVDLVMRQAEVAHRDHRDDGNSFTS